MADLSIVIVSWNVKKLLEECLESIWKNQENLTLEVFVSDNASSDGTAEMVKTKFPQVKYIQNEGNIGFPKANNRALRYAQGKYFLFLNPDTIVAPNALPEMVKFMEEHPKCGALGPKLLNPDETLQPSCRSFPTLETQLYTTFFLDVLFPKSKIFGKYLMSYWNHDEIKEVDQPMGSALLVRRNALDKVCCFDENIFIWYDEVDLCYRIKKADWKIYFTPKAKIFHYGGQSFKQWKGIRKSLWGAYVWRKSRNYFFRKYYGSWTVPILIFFDMLQIAIIIGLLYGIIKSAWFLIKLVF